MPRDSKSPARSSLLPGLSQAQVAKNLGLTVAQVARIERVALLKARAEFERRGLSFPAVISMLCDTEKH